jgi:hypothetical protein
VTIERAREHAQRAYVLAREVFPLLQGVSDENAYPVISVGMWLKLGDGVVYESGDVFPVRPLPDVLAKARASLISVSADLPPEVLRRLSEILPLLDAALAELDLTPDDPVVKAAAEA